MPQMKKGRIFRIFIWVFGSLLVLFLVILFLMRPHTPPIRGEQSIAELKKITLGGWEQWVSIRGRDISNPILLFLHGGPGMPMMYLSHVFQRPLEEEFVCVQWDRRSAGKSFRPEVPVSSISISRMLEDTRELIDYLGARFGHDKIFLAGHSFGSYVGILFAHSFPDKLHSFIGIGQVVDETRALSIQDRFIRETAQRQGMTEAIDDLKSTEVESTKSGSSSFTVSCLVERAFSLSSKRGSSLRNTVFLMR